MAHKLIFYHNPQSRAASVHWMLEEVGADYERRHVEFGKDNRTPEFLALNPMGKVPTLIADDTVFTEAAAIITWLADAYPDAGLAPEIGSLERGTWYRWLFFCGSCLEPAFIDRMFNRLPPNDVSLGYGTYDKTIAAIEQALDGRDYLVGDTFSAADLYLTAELAWGMMSGNDDLKQRSVLTDYVRRCTAREGYRKSIGATLGEVKLD